jgi:hypothetical protein
MNPEEEALLKAVMQQRLGTEPGAASEGGTSAEPSPRWTEGKGIVRYHIVGEFQGRANVVGDSDWIGYADETDRVVIELDWKLTDALLVGRKEGWTWTFTPSVKK